LQINNSFIVDLCPEVTMRMNNPKVSSRLLF